jgi:RHS repeat-associated protein
LHENFGFTGGFTDKETGFVNHWQREEDPAAGTWVRQDPVGFGARDPNLYRYVTNMPTKLVDPTGLDVYLVGGDVVRGDHNWGTHHIIVVVSDDGRMVTYEGGGIMGISAGPDDPRPVPLRNNDISLKFCEGLKDPAKRKKILEHHEQLPYGQRRVYKVRSPQGFDFEQEVRALEYGFEYLWQLPYVTGGAPNSNTYDNVLLTLAGMEVIEYTVPAHTEYYVGPATGAASEVTYPPMKTTVPQRAIGWDYCGTPYFTDDKGKPFKPGPLKLPETFKIDWKTIFDFGYGVHEEPKWPPEPPPDVFINRFGGPRPLFGR